MSVALVNDRLVRRIEKVQARYLALDGAPLEKAAQAQTFDPLLGLKLRGMKLLSFVLAPGSRGAEIRNEIRAAEIYLKTHAVDPKRFNDLSAQASERFPTPQSKLQRLDDHYVLSEVASHLNTAFVQRPDQCASLSEALMRTALATAPMGRCNAFVITDDAAGEFGVILDDALVIAVGHLAFLLGPLIRVDENDFYWDVGYALAKLDAEPGLMDAYSRFVRTFVERGSPQYTMPVALDQRSYETAHALQFLSIAWCVGHELGHASLGHVRQGSARGMIEDDTFDDLQAATAEELAADAAAYDTALAVCASWRFNPGMAIVAGGLALWAYDALYLALGRSRAPGMTSQDSTMIRAIRTLYRHPAPRERLESGGRQVAGGQIALARRFFEIVSTRFDADLQQALTAERPLRPHSRWRDFLSALALDR